MLLVSALKVHEPCLTVNSVLSTVLLLLRIGSHGSVARVRNEFIIHRLSPRRRGFSSNCCELKTFTKTLTVVLILVLPLLDEAIVAPC